MVNGLKNKNSNNSIIFKEISVSVSDFQSDSTYEGCAYKVDIVCEGVTEEYIPIVNFDIEQATSGNYSPIAITGDNIVTIYSKEVAESDFVIPSIICMY